VAFVRWVIGVFVVVPLVIGGVAATIGGVAEADGTSLLIGAVGLGLGWPLMRFLMQWE
jgi:hypothetical protein